MDTLILSCGTGAGHDAAATAIKEAIIRRGHNAVMMNPYSLKSDKLADKINRIYISIVQKTPELFGVAYAVANQYRKLPIPSPVYSMNSAMAKTLEGFFADNHFDVVVSTHVFPSEIMAQMRSKGMKTPYSVFVATDYVCVPFTEETNSDAYVIPTALHTEDFIRRGIDKEKLYPLGIPVRSAFLEAPDKDKARENLGLDHEKRYILLCGGSMGAGNLDTMIKKLVADKSEDIELIVICGSNEKLFRKLEKKYGDRIILMGRTDRIAEYIKASDLYLTKPGGLSTTEAAVMNVPFMHLPPIPGCETINAEFFETHSMSKKVKSSSIGDILNLLDDTEAQNLMMKNQREIMPKNAADEICSFLLELTGKGENV